MRSQKLSLSARTGESCGPGTRRSRLSTMAPAKKRRKICAPKVMDPFIEIFERIAFVVVLVGGLGLIGSIIVPRRK